MPISFSMRCALGAGALFVTAAIGVAGARAEAIVASGHSVSLLTASSVDPTCHSDGRVTINVIEPPRGGFLEVLQTKAFPNFNTLNSRARCNTLKLPATQVIYQSAGNFLGTDVVTLELVFPGGNARRFRLPVTVRPVTADFTPAPPPGAETITPAAPVTPARPKKLVHRKKSVAAASVRHRPCEVGCEATGTKPAERPKAPATPVKDPMVNT